MPYGWNNNYSQGITAAGGSHLIPRDFGDSRQGMGGMANRRGGSSMGRGGGGGVIRTGSGKLDPLDQLIKQLKASRKNPVADVESKFKREADLVTGAAQQTADQGNAAFMANQGNRGGMGAQLFGAGVSQQQMAPALAESAGLRTQGAVAQEQLRRDAEERYWSQLLSLEQLRAQREAAKRNWMMQRLQQGGGSPTGGGGGGGFRVIDTPSRWDRQREVDRMAPDQWGARYWENPEYQAAYDAAGQEY